MVMLTGSETSESSSRVASAKKIQTYTNQGPCNPSGNPPDLKGTRVSHGDVDEEGQCLEKSKSAQGRCFAKTVGAMPEV